jgi:CheY-like chemotaxis protein
VSVTLIIADVVMPEISGRELAERVLERWPDVPILFTSGYTGLYVVQRGLRDEGREFIQKPIAPDTLAQRFVRGWTPALGSLAPPGNSLLLFTYVRRCRLGGEDHTKSGSE